MCNYTEYVFVNGGFSRRFSLSLSSEVSRHAMDMIYRFLLILTPYSRRGMLEPLLNYLHCSVLVLQAIKCASVARSFDTNLQKFKSLIHYFK